MWRCALSVAMSSLFACEDPAAWRAVFGNYWDVVEAKSKMKKPGKLLDLEKWYQEELPTLISSRPDIHVTRSELVKLMEWKLTRGKFRPRLQQLVASNSAAAVERCSRAAFSLLPDVQAAVAELSSLTGVGPATASAVLAAAAPGRAAFMSDEAVASVPGLKPLQYTAKHYALYLGEMIQCSEKLNKADPQQDWTPHRLELCLWASANQQQLPPKEVDVKEKRSGATEQRPTKKLRTR
ncbi:uncharacterized protein zgc:112496 isoform X2 [Pseudoliparis swirei]|uniref:uncharacterized protein zgc:112496 isoform X2 n=1 Tax=Pseudoliparis swirei TaxID=2059687 RepID=UPI0024BE9A31|nr:uncharacterized protein zgc:112496 isoform X2 [Pseudoliparis swirei]